MPVMNLNNPAQLVRDYLKFMVQIQSISLHTLKAYALDLDQCLSLQGLNKSALEGFSSGDAPLAKELYPRAPSSVRPKYPDQKLSLASKNRKVASLKSFLNWCYAEKITEENWAHQFHCPKVPKKIPHFISVDEVLSVLSSFKSSYEDKRSKTLFLLLYGGGLRISEACNMKWSDIEISARRVRILGKGAKERFSVFPEFTAQALVDLRKSTPESLYVFGDKPLSQRVAFEWIRQCGQKAGLLHPLHPHALRHSFATHMLGGGTNLRTLQELLGHESLVATEKYTHLSIDQLAKTMDQSHPLAKLKIG